MRLYTFLLLALLIGNHFHASAMESNTKKLKLIPIQRVYEKMVGPQLVEAAKHNNIKKVQELLDAKADVDHKGWFGNTALIWAAENGNQDIMRLLIDAKADANIQNTYKHTALLWAAKKNHPECMQLLLNARANSQIPLHQLASNNLPACERLVEQILRLTATQKNEIYTLLLCLKKLDLTLLNKDAQKLIAQQLCSLYCAENRAKKIQEIDTIENEEIKQHLLLKYFDENQK